MYLIRVLSLCTIIISVNSKCTTTYITTCEKVSDVQKFGLKTWENLIISPDVCSGAATDTLDEVLQANFFGEAKNIEELYILDKLTTIEPNAFEGLTKLTYIKLHKNQIKVIPKGAFSNLANPIKIDLQHNGIENIEHGLFGNSLIKTINLSHNKMNNIQVDKVNLRSLKRLLVKFNDIAYVAVGSFHQSLEYLNLAHNSISNFEPGVLEPLVDLQELDLSYNRFKGISLNYGLPNLHTLDLSHNEIVLIDEGSFKMFTSLQNLKLNNNLITTLSEHIFGYGNSIRRLYLHYNAIVTLHERFGRMLQQLREISLSGNPWVCPCLQEITNYLTVRNVTQPDCDIKYFTVGKSAVCVIGEEQYCTGQEQLTKEVFENFSKSLNIDLCGDI